MTSAKSIRHPSISTAPNGSKRVSIDSGGPGESAGRTYSADFGDGLAGSLDVDERVGELPPKSAPSVDVWSCLAASPSITPNLNFSLIPN